MLNQAKRRDRRGVSAVEAAVVMPLVVLITIGGIDFSQYINMQQLVSNASREGARMASRGTTNSTDEVEAAVINYLRDWYPADNFEDFQKDLTVTVTAESQDNNDDNDNESKYSQVNSPIPSGDLSQLEPHAALKIVVQCDFESVRWIPGPNYWGDGQTIITYCRRE